MLLPAEADLSVMGAKALRGAMAARWGYVFARKGVPPLPSSYEKGEDLQPYSKLVEALQAEFYAHEPAGFVVD